MKKTNKLLILTVFCALLISLFTAVNISAESSGICGDYLTWTLTADGTLVISGTGDMYDYEPLETPWYSLYDSIEDIEIGEGVSSIGSYAFSGCNYLNGITVPDNVVRIGEGAFYKCNNLNSIDLPFVGERAKTSGDRYQYPFGYIFGEDMGYGGVLTEQVYYGESAEDMTRTSYYIPNSLKKVTVRGGEILKGAFDNCRYIEQVILGDVVRGIGDNAFDSCRSLRSITFGKEINNIGNGAFRECTSFVSFNVPDTVTNIGENAFRGCSSLADIKIPESVTSIGDNAFEDCYRYINVVCGCDTAAYYYVRKYDVNNYYVYCTKELTDYVYNNDATCTKDGTMTARCSICKLGRTKTAEGTALGHRYGSFRDNKDASCTEDGTKSRVCVRCETTETVPDEGSALGHLFNNYYRNQDATCTADGTMTSKCFRCDEINTIADKGSALGHTAGEWLMTKEPEIGIEGERAKYCTVCNEILETEAVPALTKEMTFTDVTAEHWYYDAVEYCYKQSIINGVSESEFAPQTELSRAMLVRILWNMEGCPETAEKYFTDIGTDRWYTDAVNWAAEKGIVAGMDSEHFCPEDAVTREQLAAIMRRYSAYLGNDVSARSELNNYTDADEISDWAYTSVEWAVSAGIISGRSETTLVPKGTATRAETAQIIYIFVT